MTSAVETMAYAGQVPWHGLGNKVSNDLTPAAMLKAAGINWTVSKRKVFHEVNGKMQAIDREYVLARDSDNKVLSMVGEIYKPVQNDVAMDFFRKFVEAAKMKMETAGSLWDGRYIWGLAKIGADFTLAKGDKIEGYMLMCQPHVHGKAMLFQFTPIRVVCWNTLTFAIGKDLTGKGGKTFRMPHSTDFNESVKTQAELALGLATEQMADFKEVATLLAKKKAAPLKVEQYFAEVLKFDPKKAEKKKTNGEPRVPVMLPKFRAALEHAPGQALPTAAGTWWGALNAVTYVIDHETGRERSTALRNAWLGHMSNVKRRAVDLAIARAK